MAGMDWFRWHHGSVTDPKFQLVARRTKTRVADVIAVWASILEEASQAEERGCPGLIDFEAIDCLLGLDDGQAKSIHSAMTDRGLLGEDGSISSWDKRQPKREREDLTSTERSRNSRARKAAFDACNAQAQIASAEASSENQTDPSDTTRSHATPCNAMQRQETPREEKRREEEKELRETEMGSASRKRAAPSPACPDDVSELTWSDWLGLRKAKKAPVTETVLAGARSEALKAGLTLEQFLVVWCTRGSQGLQADWLRPEERGRQAPIRGRPTGPPSEPAWRAEQRSRVQQLAPGVAARPMTQSPTPEFIDVEAHYAHAPRLA